MTTPTRDPQCDNCDRRAACVATVHSSMGETAQCCDCRQCGDEDGYCDDCRPEDDPPAENPRERGDDDGVEYADPRDAEFE